MAEVEVFNAITEIISEIAIMTDLQGNDLGITLLSVSLILSFVFLLNNDIKNMFLTFLVGGIIIGTTTGTFLSLAFAGVAAIVVLVEVVPMLKKLRTKVTSK